jgi:hypothetical protein
VGGGAEMLRRISRVGAKIYAEFAHTLLPGWVLAESCARLHVTGSLGVEMGPRTQSKSSRDKVRAHRKRLRQQGLRPIQIWVPDMRSPAFLAEAHRQSLAVSKSPQAKKDQDFINAVSDRGER